MVWCIHYGVRSGDSSSLHWWISGSKTGEHGSKRPRNKSFLHSSKREFAIGSASSWFGSPKWILLLRKKNKVSRPEPGVGGGPSPTSRGRGRTAPGGAFLTHNNTNINKNISQMAGLYIWRPWFYFFFLVIYCRVLPSQCCHEAIMKIRQLDVKALNTPAGSLGMHDPPCMTQGCMFQITISMMETFNLFLCLLIFLYFILLLYICSICYRFRIIIMFFRRR